MDKRLPLEVYFDKTQILINNKIFEFSPTGQLLKTDNHLNYLILDPERTSYGLVEIQNFNVGYGDSKRKTSRGNSNHASMSIKVGLLDDLRKMPNEMKFSVLVFDEFREIEPMTIDFVVRGV